MKKTKKHVLLHSLIAIALCVSMLVGATFAWFTDSVVNGNNIIATGLLDVALYHTNATETDEAVDVNTQLFLDDKGNTILWEPGVVSWENLRIANEGNLALSYKFSLTTANENYIIDGANQYGLSQALKIGLVPGGLSDTSSREAVVAAVTEWKPLASFESVGYLLPAGNDPTNETFGIVVYWEPGADDNRWNLNNGKTLNEGDVLSIDLGVQLLASQQPYETDAFDKDYDFDASYFFEGVSQESSNVTTNNGEVSENTTIGKTDSTVSAQVAAGTKVNTDELVLTVKKLEDSSANIQVEADQVSNSVDVHVAGVAADNDVPILVTVKEMMPASMNVGNYTLYHVENGTPVAMTLVESNPVNHNEYVYDPITGDVTMALASFSEIMVVSDKVNMWLGIVDTAFGRGDGTEENPFIIANADQLALMSKLVSQDASTLTAYDEANEGANPDFNTAHYKLYADIDFGGEQNATALEGELSDVRSFYPIGAWKQQLDSNDNLMVDEKGAPIYGYGAAFQGHFDGNGNTIRNLYQNTWAMNGLYNSGYSGTPYYWDDSMGLFGYVFNATIENLCIDNFQSDGEFTPTGCVAAFAGGNSTFEDIILLNSNPRVYNTGNGGIVGLNYNSTSGAEDHLVFRDITVDSSNKISALWGSYDVSCGGILGRLRENSKHIPVKGETDYSSGFNTATFENCNVSPIIDVYNDVCANYQYYQYRYSGMLIGTCDYVGDVPEIGPEDVVLTNNCTVTLGSWNEYWYCELVANSLASYTHDHQFSRLDKVEKVNPDTMKYLPLGKTDTEENWVAIPTSGRVNYVVVNGVNKDENGTCYHFVDGVKWNHEDAGKETINGQEILKEDRQHYYLPFAQLFTGYGWGSSPVKFDPTTDNDTTVWNGVTIKYANDVNALDKFQPVTGLAPEYYAGNSFKLNQLFSATGNGTINNSQVEVFVSPVGKSTANAKVEKGDTDNWEDIKLTLEGEGVLKITVTDYDNCKYAVQHIYLASNVHPGHCVGHDCADGECNHDDKLYGWQPWDGRSNIYESGNYYLTQDVTENQYQRQLGALRVNENNKENFDIKINLCLNGHKIISKTRAFACGYGVTVNLMNCGGKEGGKLSTLTGHGIRSDGTTEDKNRAQAGVLLVQSAAKLSIYNNIDFKLEPYKHTDDTLHYPRSGGILEVSSGAIVDFKGTHNLTGGEIKHNTYSNQGGNGGTIYTYGEVILGSGVTVSGGSASNVGGNIFATGNAKLTVNGAKILDGTAKAGGNIYANGGATIVLGSGSVSGGTANNGAGGNINAQASTVTVNGGSITNGTSTGGHGGNIYVGDDAVVTIKNAVVKSGEAKPVDGATSNDALDKNGGNIAVAGNNNSTLILGNGAVIGGNGQEGGVADRGGNIFFYCGNVTVEGDAQILGGEARNLGYGGGSDCFHVNGTTSTKYSDGTTKYWYRTLTLKGTPTITELRIQNDVTKSEYDTVDASGLTGGSIGISHDISEKAVVENKTCHAAFATNGTGKLGYFTNANPNLAMEEENGVLYLNYHGTHCTCGENHTSSTADGCDDIEGEWKPWDGLSAISEGGNYYLTQDISPEVHGDKAVQYWMGGSSTGPAEPIEINLCLNGHSIASKYRVFGVAKNVTFNLMNCSDTKAVLSGKGDNGNDGGVILIHGTNAEMNVYGNIQISPVANITRGGAIYNNGRLNVYGTEITAGNTTCPIGGAIFNTNTGIANLYGAEITANNATGSKGGAIYNNGTLNVQNSVIRGSHLTKQDDSFGGMGGAIYNISGTVTLTNSTVYGAKVENVGGTGDSTTDKRGFGGAIYSTGGKVVADGTKVYGSEVWGDGGAIYLCQNAQLEIKGNSTIYAGKASWLGGAIAARVSTITMTGGTIEGSNPEYTISGNHAVYGGGVLVENSTFNMSGGTIQNCKASNGGGLFVSTNATATISGNIQTCTATNGGGVYVNNSATCTMNGGQIYNCGAIKTGNDNGLGGCVCVQTGGTFTMSAGTLTGGQAQWGSALYARGNVTISGSAVINGTTSTDLKQGGAVYISTGGNVTMENGTINGCKVTQYGGAVTLYDTAKMTMNDGTINGGTGTYGGAVYLQSSNASFTMNGGTITGGKATTNNGGNICMDAGTFTMNGGTITAGSAVNGGNVEVVGGTFDMKNGTISNGTASANGGNVYVRNTGTFKMTGGTVTGGVANGSGIGGNIMNNGAVVEILGGTVTNGTGDYGGNIATVSASATAPGKLTLKDTSITGGTSRNTKNLGAGVYMKWNGTTKNYTEVVFGGKLIISGNKGSMYNKADAIDGVVLGEANVYMEHGARITLDAMSAGSDIGLTLPWGGVFTTGTVDAAWASYFHGDLGIQTTSVDANGVVTDPHNDMYRYPNVVFDQATSSLKLTK